MSSSMDKSTREEDAVFTVCNIAYLPKALVLADSLAQHERTALNIILFDEKQALPFQPVNAKITWIEDVGFPQWKQLAFMYDIIEFSTSLKPFIASKLLDAHERVIFLDPDTAIYHSLDPIKRDLAENPVVLTPHYLEPQPDTETESDLAMMRFGSFNLGFFAVRKSKEASSFLSWWHKRCIDFCFMESQFGLSTDQKWISIAPCFFDFLKISRNPGYNAAPWNTFERKITINEGSRYIVNEKNPLVFFHFSNYDHNDPQYLNKRASIETGINYPILEELSLNYSKALRLYEKEFTNHPYSFDYMSDGSYISPTLRRAYACVRNELPGGTIDPFDSEGPVGNFARKNRLLIRGKQVRYRHPGFRDASKNQKIIALASFVMRAFMRMFGPNRFQDLSKLMVLLSMTRKNRNYWKI